MNGWQLRFAHADGHEQCFVLSERVHLLGSGRSCDLALSGLPVELLQLWRDGESYRVVRMSRECAVRVNGAEADERVLAAGDLLECGPWVLRFEREGSSPSANSPMSTAPARAPAAAPTAAPALAGSASAGPAAPAAPPRWVAVAAAAWIAEQGKLAKPVQQKWEKVLRDGGAFAAEECAAEVLAAATLDDARPQAAVHALRDALAKRLIRAAHRGVARKRFVARLVVQAFVLTIVMGAVLGGALLLRTTFGIDWNGLCDGALEALRALRGGVL
jgi:hypothetical protein